MEDVRDKSFIFTSLVGQNCLVAMIERTIFATKLNFVVMTDYEYIVQQVGVKGQRHLKNVFQLEKLLFIKIFVSL